MSLYTWSKANEQHRGSGTSTILSNKHVFKKSSLFKHYDSTINLWRPGILKRWWDFFYHLRFLNLLQKLLPDGTLYSWNTWFTLYSLNTWFTLYSLNIWFTKFLCWFFFGLWWFEQEEHKGKCLHDKLKLTDLKCFVLWGQIKKMRTHENLYTSFSLRAGVSQFLLKMVSNTTEIFVNIILQSWQRC